MAKKCTDGLNCGGTCIEKKDKCRVKLKSVKAKKSLNRLSGGLSEQQKTAINNIETRFAAELQTEKAQKLIKKAIMDKDSPTFKRSLNAIRHGTAYDKILDEERAKLNNDSDWRAVYNASKNSVTAAIDKQLLENCNA